ncbi:MAG: glutamine amidotransferase [Arenicella sp.]|jgi:glutamine amidotransferase
MQIAIIDLGIGNLRSVAQALSTVADDADIVVTSDAKLIAAADKLVLPGQGAIGSWFAALEQRGLREVINQSLAEKPMLGICVGMQAMFRHCEEDGGVDGLGLFDGSVRHFRSFHPALATQKNKMKIPQMGWNRVSQTIKHPLWQGIADQAYFYFVHSYCANLSEVADRNIVFGTADYGHEFIAAIGRDNLFAVQFHPEKSHRDGLQLFSNFVNWNGVS